MYIEVWRIFSDSRTIFPDSGLYFPDSGITFLDLRIIFPDSNKISLESIFRHGVPTLDLCKLNHTRGRTFKFAKAIQHRVGSNFVSHVYLDITTRLKICTNKVKK